jgi:DNA-binding NarL/FixJ family response regulator
MSKRPDEPANRPKQVFIVDDHPTFREGLVQALDAGNGLAVCGEADSAEEALDKIKSLKPDLVVVDLTLPGKSGLDLIKELRAQNQEIKLLVVSMHDEALYAERVLRAGGNGYIMKQEDPEEIVNAVQDVLAGHIYVSEPVMAGRQGEHAAPERVPAASSDLIARLTDDELEMLELLGLGKSEEEIAQHLNTTLQAVTKHCREIQKKLNLKSGNALVRYAVCWVEQGKT